MKLFKNILTGISVLVIATSCMIVLLTQWSGDGWKFLSVPTSSMRPNMPTGSLALMHRVPDSSLEVGDIITYANPLNPKLTVSHRIIKIETAKNKMSVFITKGDANPTPDVKVLAFQVKGRIVWHVRDLGWLILWSKTLLGIAILIYLPAMLITIEEIQRLNTYFKESQPYKLIGYKRYVLVKDTSKITQKMKIGISAFIIVLLGTGLIGANVEALLASNRVALSNNLLIVKVKKQPKQQCTGSSNNNITVNNSSTQTGTSGNATVIGNTSDGSASSGSVTNNNTTTTTISITNC